MKTNTKNGNVLTVLKSHVRWPVGDYFKRGPMYSWKSQMALLAMVLPAFACVIVFSYIPIYGITFAFRNIKMSDIWNSPWVDPWYKYFSFLSSPIFWKVFKNTVVIACSKFVFGFWPAIVLALLLNELRNLRFKKVVQTISYLPHFISWVIIANMVNALLNLEYGPLPALVKALGMEPISIIGSESAFVPLVVITAIWHGIGWDTILYLAAISGISQTLYEAAEIDGAGRFKKMLYITLPGMVPTISILLVLNIPGLINAGFDQVFNFQNSMVLGVAEIVDTYIMKIGLDKGSYSLATAVGLFNSVLGVTLLLVSNKISKKLGGQGIW